MKYINYGVADFIQDEYFLLWVLNPDAMTINFWENWLADHPDKREVVDKSKRLVLLMNVGDDKLSDQDFDLMWRNIIEKRSGAENAVRTGKKAKQQQLLRIAAVFIGLILTVVGLHSLGLFNSTPSVPITAGPQITLEFEDGTIKVLDANSSQILSNKKGNLLVKQEENRLQYENGDQVAETITYNQLSVPYGKKFELLLSDGSHVFLNSGSKLRYPVNFLKDVPRNVYLVGEAYFSVQKDESRPFTVMTDNMNTRVHGTEFNVTSYGNENSTSTVLVEGSVDVYLKNGGNPDQYIMIEPGQRAVFEDNAIVVDNVDVGKYISWKEGRLLFVDDSFDIMIKQLERHFNIGIDNRFTALNDKKFTGTFEKETLGQILRVFQEHTPFDYSLEGNTITITERK